MPSARPVARRPGVFRGVCPLDEVEGCVEDERAKEEI